MCRARLSEQATPASLPVRFRAGDLHPAQDTIVPCRTMCLPAGNDLWVPIWVLAPAADVRQWGHISLDGPTLHADASTSHAVRDQRLLALAHPWRAAVDAWCARGEPAAPVRLPAGLLRADERARRQARLATWAQAHAVWEARAPARDQAERTEDEAQRRARAATARPRQPRGPPPQPPQPGPREREQDHCTAPESRLMKHRHNAGVDPHDKAPSATDHHRWLVGAHALSNHANEPAAGEPTVAAWPDILGPPPAGALDTGYCRAATRPAVAQRGIAPSSAVGRAPPHPPGSADGAPPLAPPPEEASPLVKLADTRPPEIGQALDRLRTCPVEPVLGLLKAVRGWRHFSLRGLPAAAGAWWLGGVAFPLQRLPVL